MFSVALRKDMKDGRSIHPSSMHASISQQYGVGWCAKVGNGSGLRTNKGFTKAKSGLGFGCA